MDFAPLSPDDYLKLASEQAHRFPEKYVISLPGDRGATVRIPIVLGNPSGACKMPPGQKPSVAWANYIAAVFRARPENVELVRQAATDCLLWPDSATWNQIIGRWPAAADPLWQAAREKCGAALASMNIPGKDETPPEPIAKALDKYERAVWRRLYPTGDEVVVVVDAPKSIAWTFFSDAMKKSDADRWSLVCEMAQIAVPAAVRAVPATMQAEASYEPISFVDEVMRRWPGFAVHVGATISELAGISAAVQREAW